MSDTIQVTVDILDRPYRLGCPAHEEAALRASAASLDARLRKMREQSSPSVTVERIAVTAALNLTHELRSLQDNADHVSEEQAHARVMEMGEALAHRMDEALEQGARLLERSV